MGTISSFKGRYAFLSNFAHCEVEFEGDKYITTEHAFQAAKTFNKEERTEIREALTPAIAKRFGKEVTLREDWEDVKVDIMYNLLKQKFSIPEFREQLLATGNAKLIEGNHWNDTFWGVCNGVGRNMLGELLMQLREEIKEDLHNGNID